MLQSSEEDSPELRTLLELAFGAKERTLDDGDLQEISAFEADAGALSALRARVLLSDANAGESGRCVAVRTRAFVALLDATRSLQAAAPRFEAFRFAIHDVCRAALLGGADDANEQADGDCFENCRLAYAACATDVWSAIRRLSVKGIEGLLSSRDEKNSRRRVDSFLRGLRAHLVATYSTHRDSVWQTRDGITASLAAIGAGDIDCERSGADLADLQGIALECLCDRQPTIRASAASILNHVLSSMPIVGLGAEPRDFRDGEASEAHALAEHFVGMVSTEGIDAERATGALLGMRCVLQHAYDRLCDRDRDHLVTRFRDSVVFGCLGHPASTVRTAGSELMEFMVRCGPEGGGSGHEAVSARKSGLYDTFDRVLVRRAPEESMPFREGKLLTLELLLRGQADGSQLLQDVRDCIEDGDAARLESFTGLIRSILAVLLDGCDANFDVMRMRTQVSDALITRLLIPALVEGPARKPRCDLDEVATINSANDEADRHGDDDACDKLRIVFFVEGFVRIWTAEVKRQIDSLEGHRCLFDEGNASTCLKQVIAFLKNANAELGGGRRPFDLLLARIRRLGLLSPPTGILCDVIEVVTRQFVMSESHDDSGSNDLGILFEALLQRNRGQEFRRGVLPLLRRMHDILPLCARQTARWNVTSDASGECGGARRIRSALFQFACEDTFSVDNERLAASLMRALSVLLESSSTTLERCMRALLTSLRVLLVATIETRLDSYGQTARQSLLDLTGKAAKHLAHAIPEDGSVEELQTFVSGVAEAVIKSQLFAKDLAAASRDDNETDAESDWDASDDDGSEDSGSRFEGAGHVHDDMVSYMNNIVNSTRGHVSICDLSEAAQKALDVRSST